MWKFLKLWIRGWLKLFLSLYLEVVQNPPSKKEDSKERLIGFALLKKDDFTGKKYWSTWDGDGGNEIIFSAGQALTFPPNELQIGTRIHFLPPEE